MGWMTEGLQHVVTECTTNASHNSKLFETYTWDSTLDMANRSPCNHAQTCHSGQVIKSKAVHNTPMEVEGGGGRMYSSYSFTTSALDRCEWSASRSGRALPPGEGTLWTGGWVGPKAGLDTEIRGKIYCLCRGSNLDGPVVQSVARHYINWATSVLAKLYSAY
jgi:hypothetical protein